MLQMARESRTPGGRRPSRPLAIGGGLVVVLAIAFAVVYFVLFPTSSAKKFTLPKTAASPVTAGTSLAGSWRIATGSQAGYRVREKLGFLPAESDAVGRTSAITGAATLAQAGSTVTITSAGFDVDVAKLTSDQAMRDQHIQTLGIQSATYPTATFKLLAPITLPSSALSGSAVTVPVTGVFEIHGTSRTETIPVALRLSDSAVEAVGSLTFPWSDFKMTAPSVAGFVSVTGTATMEFDLDLQRA
jgi:polyisoprenoid-binding protein YceI